MTKPRLCILSFSNLAYDRRVLREIEAARTDFDVDVIAFGEWTAPNGVRYYRLSREKPSLSKRYAAYLLGRIIPSLYDQLFWSYGEYQKAYALLLQNQYDLVHANDWDSLPVAGRAAEQVGVKVLFDAHEDSLEQQADRLEWRLTKQPYRKYLFMRYSRGIKRMITVSQGIADSYYNYFGWKMDVIHNAPTYIPLSFHPVISENIRIVHHGGAAPQRRIEDMIEMMDFLPNNYSLDLYLLPGESHEYLDRLKTMAAQRPERVRILDPIRPAELLATINQYDIGLSFMEAVQKNHLNAMPNKFFDFIMAGLAVISSDLPLMGKIIREKQIGAVTDGKTPAEKAVTITGLSVEKINTCKQNSLELAKRMNAGTEMERLLSIYEEMGR